MEIDLKMPIYKVNSIPHVRYVLESIVKTLNEYEPISDLEELLKIIPPQASETNKLTDRNFVNSSIATSTATFRGTSAPDLTEEEFLAWANTLEKDKNDYIFWNTVDSVGNTQFKRYKYSGEEWQYEYTLNNSSFTAEQWASIQSGITSSLVTKLIELYSKDTMDSTFVKSTDVRNIVVCTQQEYDDLLVKDANTEYNIV